MRDELTRLTRQLLAQVEAVHSLAKMDSACALTRTQAVDVLGSETILRAAIKAGTVKDYGNRKNMGLFDRVEINTAWEAYKRASQAHGVTMRKGDGS